MRLKTILSWILVAAAVPVMAQGHFKLDSVRLVKQSTYEYNPTTQKKYLASYKESSYDTNKIMTFQQRYTYYPADTGLVTISYYAFLYNAFSKLGSYYTERFPTPKNPKQKYSKLETKFKSYNHEDEREWIKQYNEKGELISETSYAYDNGGFRIRTQTRDLKSQIMSIDNMERNKLGKILTWRAYDEENGNQTQVREMQWSYLNDSLILTSSGYVYNNYTETVNEYDKKNQLVESVMYSGYRQDGGKVIRENKTVTAYKDGKPQKTTVYLAGKKVSTSQFRYEPNFIEETIDAKEDNRKIKTIKTTKELYQGDKLTDHTELENGAPKYSIQHIYVGNVIVKTTEIEYKSNRDEWKTIIEFNDKGNPVRKAFFIQNQLQQEDLYEYDYFK